MQEALTFDDVTMEPQYSEVMSRKNPNISRVLKFRDGKDILIRNPFISSPMDTVTEASMAIAMSYEGAFGIIHRYNTPEHQANICKEVFRNGALCGAAIGATGDFFERAKKLYDAGVRVFCIDVAHGHHILVERAIKELRDHFGEDIHIMAGNIATAKAMADLAMWGADSVRLGIGGGCLAGDTRILMADGYYKNIKDIKVGEYVINSMGQKVRVKNVINSGFKKVVKVRNSLFYKNTFITPDHKVWQYDCSPLKEGTSRSQGYKKSINKRLPLWLGVGDCDKRNILLLPRNIHFDIPKTFDVDGLKPSYDLGYIFGTFLGDGNCQTGEFFIPSRQRKQKQGQCTWYFGKNEGHIAQKLIKSLEKVFDVECPIVPTNNTLNVYLYRKKIADLFSEFGKKTEKHLPRRYWCQNKGYLQGIYDGLMDSDGTWGSRNSLSNTSPQLIELFNVIIYLLKGYFPNNINRGKRAGGLKNCNPENLNDAYVSRELARPERRVNDSYQFVKFLEKGAVEIELETFDIEVDCPTHSFIANNMIVHNSICSSRINAGHGIPNFSCIQACFQVFKGHGGPSIIADGGIRKTGDIVKALAAGADFVMCGSLFAATLESPGEIIDIDGKKYKPYRGMASHESQRDWRNHSAGAEGIATTIPFKGSVRKIIPEMSLLVRSGLSYSGAMDIEQLRQKAIFVRQSAASIQEGFTHILYK